MAMVAGGAALAGGLAGLFGGGNTANNVQLPPQFNMPNMGEAAGNAYSMIGSIPGAQYGGQFAPLAAGTGMNLYNNPYASLFQQGSGPAGGMGMAGGVNSFNAGGQLMQGGSGLLPYAGALETMGMDPQNALYSRTLGQVTDSTSANLANSGILNTPYGQSVLGNTTSNFNIDWQNQQLQRAISGVGGGAAALQGAAGAFQSGQGMQFAAPAQYLYGAGLPYSTYNTIGQGQLGGITGAQGAIGGSQSLYNPQISDYLSYLGAGNTAGNVANQQSQVALNQANASFNQNQIFGSQVGAGLYGMGRAGFPSFGGFGGGGSSLYGNIGR